MINSLQGRIVYSTPTFSETPKTATSVNSYVAKTNSQSRRLFAAADSQLMIVNNKITGTVEEIVEFIYQLHNQSQLNEQNLKNFELKLLGLKIDPELKDRINLCEKGLLKAEDIGTGNYSLIMSYQLSLIALHSLDSFSDKVAKFSEMNKLSFDVFSKLGPSFDLLIPEIREKSKEFYRINNALELSWGFAEIKDSILQLAHMQKHLQDQLVKQLESVKEYGKLLSENINKLDQESKSFEISINHPLFTSRSYELGDEIHFLTKASSLIGEGVEIYGNLLNFLDDCQKQLHMLCESIDQLETYCPLLIKSQLDEVGY